MVISLRETTAHLWRRAPYWRLSVVGGGVFTVLSAIYLWSGGEAETSAVSMRAPPPTLAPDPASDARLSDYQTAHDQAVKITVPGARCEDMASAFEALSVEDVKRGRNIIASSRARIVVLSDGERCHDDIAKSDQHFTRVAQLVAAAQAAATPQALMAAADSLSVRPRSC